MFDDLARIEIRPRRQNEALFDYLNMSARPGIAAMRHLIDEWFDRLPEASKPDIRARFRLRDEIQHVSAFFELYCHEIPTGDGYMTGALAFQTGRGEVEAVHAIGL